MLSFHVCLPDMLTMVSAVLCFDLQASKIYMAFVFQKVAKADDAKAPPVPPPERKETGGFRAGGGGAGGAGGRGPQRYGNDKVGAPMCDCYVIPSGVRSSSSECSRSCLSAAIQV